MGMNRARLIQGVAIVAFIGTVYSSCATGSTLRVVMDRENNTDFRRGVIAMNDALDDHKLAVICFSTVLLATALLGKKPLKH